MIAGDVVNTAARLQAAAPVNGILVGEETHAATQGAIAYEPAPPVVAKGKARAASRVAGAARGSTRRASAVCRCSAVGRHASSRRCVDLAADDRGAPAASRHGSRRGRRRQDAARGRVRASSPPSSAAAPSTAARCPTATAAPTGRSRRSSSSSPGSSRATRSDVALAKLGKRRRGSRRRRSGRRVARHLSIVLGLDPSQSVPDRGDALLLDPRLPGGGRSGASDRARLRGPPLGRPQPARPRRDAERACCTTCRSSSSCSPGPSCSMLDPSWGGGLPSYTALPLQSALARRRGASSRASARVADARRS